MWVDMVSFLVTSLFKMLFGIIENIDTMTLKQPINLEYHLTNTVTKQPQYALK